MWRITDLAAAGCAGARAGGAAAGQGRRLHGADVRDRARPATPAAVRGRAGRARAGGARRREPAPFLDLTAMVARRRPRARAAVDGVRARLRDHRALLRLPDRAPGGEIQIREYRRSAANPDVGRPGLRAAAARDPARPTRPTTTAGRCSSGRTGKLWLGTGDGGGGNNQFGHAQDPASLLGKLIRLDPAAPAPEIVSRRAAQPVAVLVRPRDRAARDRRRRPGRVGGDRHRARRELRLAVLRGHARRTAVEPALRGRRGAPGGRASRTRRRVLLDHRRLRRPRSRAADAGRPLPLRRLLRGRAAVVRRRERRRPTPRSASTWPTCAPSARTPAGASSSCRWTARCTGWWTARRRPCTSTAPPATPTAACRRARRARSRRG